MTNLTKDQTVENEIMQATIDALLTAGYFISVYDTWDITVRNSTDRAEIFGAMKTTGEDYLWAIEPKNPGERFGWVRFIYGNNGDEVINDYTTNLETVIAPVNALSDSLAA